LLREIFDLARAQRASLEQDDIERMLDLMTEREVILDRLIRLVEEPEVEPANVLAFPGTPDLSRQDAIALDTDRTGVGDRADGAHPPREHRRGGAGLDAVGLAQHGRYGIVPG
jgi:hypothetical protein